jgi:hypothetical protein
VTGGKDKYVCVFSSVTPKFFLQHFPDIYAAFVFFIPVSHFGNALHG